jgi:hypothetical protein
MKTLSCSAPQDLLEEIDRRHQEAQAAVKEADPGAVISKSKLVCRWIRAGMAADGPSNK